MRIAAFVILSACVSISLFADEEETVRKHLKVKPKKLVVERKKTDVMEKIGFNYEDSSMADVLTGFSGNAFYSQAVWSEGKKEASLNMGGSLAMIDADVRDFEDMAGNTVGAQVGVSMKNGEARNVATSWGVDIVQSVYDSKNRSSTGVRMHYGLTF